MPAAASSKRSRRAAFGGDGDGDGDDDGSNDGVTITQASSSLRNDAQRKKARVSKAGTSRKSAWTPPERDTPDSDDDEVMQEPDAPPTPPAATQYELMRDAGFKHLEYIERDDQRATQRLKDRPVLIGDNHASLNAIIESITCINFMCHVRLHCELGPLLNFIVGENGSGKSAILTAITLCLGGKASATNRGGSLRSFVKEGQEHASLIVKIKNQGDDAYKPDLFGESIIFERWFTKSGSSGFKLKSAASRVISTKKADVDDVVEYFCLQVDNPLNVLSQDNARQFLNAATPATKYKYFVQGTQLEQLDHDYQLLTEMLDANEAKLSEHQENISYLKEKYEKAVKLRDAVGKSAEMRQRSKLYSNQLAWAQVIEQETILEQKEAAILTADEEVSGMEQTIAEKTNVLDGIDNRIQEAEEATEAVRQEEGQIKEQEQEAKTNYDNAKKAIEETHAQERDIHSQLSNASQKVKEYERKIREEEQRLEAVNGGALAEKQKELADAKHVVEEIRESIMTHSSALPKLNEEFAAAEREAQEWGERVEQKRKELSAAEARIRTLSQNRSDPWAGFDAQMPQLLRLIENDNGFTEKPIGPIGAHVRLTKPKWSTVLEKFFGQSLSGFIVKTRPDQVRLQAYMDKLRIRNSQIFIGKASINRLREPDPNFDTILRVLKFDDQRVRDQLIIGQSIEQTILIEDRIEGQRVMLDGQSPENVLACLCFHDSRRGHGLRISKRVGTHFSTSPITPNPDQKPRMKSDEDSQIAFYKDSLEQLRVEYRELEVSGRNFQQAAQRASQAVAQHKRRAKSLESELRQASLQVTHIEEALDKFDGLDGRLQGLKDDLEEAKAQKDHYGYQYGELAMQKSEMNKEVENLKQELNKAKLASRDFKAKLAKAEDKVKRYQETRRVAVVEKNQAYENLELAKTRKSQAEGSRDRQAATVADYTRQASTVVPERVYIPEGETYQSIERKYESIREQLRKMRSQLGASEEEINNRAAQATQEYREAKKNNKNLTSLVDGLKKALMDRLGKYRSFQRHVSAHARTNFGYLLSERGFRGQLLLDHKSKKLEVQVEPDETRRNGKGRNTKTLSGGEKSFSSICLLLAIWDAMGSPLRCLDEFDVFMDNVNRAISTNMLITAARRSVGKQFILITPNAIEGRANIDKDVKIIRLTDPRQRLLADH
ncbi:P-loop containing nucleoside triphosphate hydrolase protein [Biscogniauxia marginata]|nr:P-loop containing nucleoside triphosphate hydrolase protein [Biscogniauxia marginata]